MPAALTLLFSIVHTCARAGHRPAAQMFGRSLDIGPGQAPQYYIIPSLCPQVNCFPRGDSGLGESPSHVLWADLMKGLLLCYNGFSECLQALMRMETMEVTVE